MSKGAEPIPLLQRYYSLESIAREPWHDESTLYMPVQAQCLLNGATSLATLLYLNELGLKFKIEIMKNVCEMSPSGSLITIGYWRQSQQQSSFKIAFQGKSPVLKCGKYVVGEFETIVNFCSLKNLSLCKSSVEERKAYVCLIENQFSEVLDFFLFAQKESTARVKQIYTDLYPKPLNIFLYYREYFFIRNKLILNKIWKLNKDQVLKRLKETAVGLNRKLKSSQYLIENRLTEVDILLYSYMKIVSNYNEFDDVKFVLFQFDHLNKFFSDMNDKYKDLIRNFNSEYTS